MNGTAQVSVIIRNRNEAVYLQHVLHALSLQDATGIEVILVDNESTDNSTGIGLDYDAKVVTISKASFTYGRALNIGLREATADICVILSAHSLPLGRSFLTECMRPFEDERVAAVRCIYAGKGADLTRWMEPEVLDASSDFISKGPLASGCAIRRKVWLEIPFDEEVAKAEEKLWAAEVLKKGYSIYSPSPAFYYYMKKIPPIARLRENYQELLEIYRSIGKRIGFANRSVGGTIIDLAKGIFYRSPLAALNVARQELLTAYLRLSFTKQARNRPKAGSIT